VVPAQWSIAPPIGLPVRAGRKTAMSQPFLSPPWKGGPGGVAAHASDTVNGFPLPDTMLSSAHDGTGGPGFELFEPLSQLRQFGPGCRVSSELGIGRPPVHAHLACFFDRGDDERRPVAIGRLN